MTEIQAMQAAAPLLNLAGQFHAHFKIVNVPDVAPAENSVLVALGESSSRPGQALTTGAERVWLPDGTHSDGNRSDGTPPATGRRLVLANTSQGQRIVDTAGQNDTAFKRPSHAALLTIVNGASQAVHIDGTDQDSINALVDMLCGRDTFPASLNNLFEAGTVT